MAKRGELGGRSETDSSNAVFVSRKSVEAFRAAHTPGPSKRQNPSGNGALADVIRFTGRSRIELLDPRSSRRAGTGAWSSGRANSPRRACVTGSQRVRDQRSNNGPECGRLVWINLRPCGSRSRT